jgi:hypothetical protein
MARLLPALPRAQALCFLLPPCSLFSCSSSRCRGVSPPQPISVAPPCLPLRSSNSTASCLSIASHPQFAASVRPSLVLVSSTLNCALYRLVQFALLAFRAGPAIAACLVARVRRVRPTCAQVFTTTDQRMCSTPATVLAHPGRDLAEPGTLFSHGASARSRTVHLWAQSALARGRALVAGCRARLHGHCLAHLLDATWAPVAWSRCSCLPSARVDARTPAHRLCGAHALVHRVSCVLAFAVEPLNPFSPARPRLRPSGGHCQYGTGLHSFIWSHWLSTLLVLSMSNQQAPPPSLNCSPRVCS